jgi:hypothetical protein
VENVKKTWLPDLSSSSDHAWGFWHRAKNGQNLADVNMIFTCMITNDVTEALIAEAFKTYAFLPGEEKPTEVKKWPGTTFEMHRPDAAQVLLGMFTVLRLEC